MAKTRYARKLVADVEARLRAGQPVSLVARETGMPLRSVYRFQVRVREGRAPEPAPSSELALELAPAPAAGRPVILHDAEPPAAAAAPAGPAPPEPIEARALVDLVCALVDSRVGEPDLALYPPEDMPREHQERAARQRERLAQAWEPVIIKYLPLYAQYAVEVNALVVTVAVFAPVIMAQRDRAQRRNAAADREREGVKEEPAHDQAAGAPSAAAADLLRQFAA